MTEPKLNQELIELFQRVLQLYAETERKIEVTKVVWTEFEKISERFEEHL